MHASVTLCRRLEPQLLPKMILYTKDDLCYNTSNVMTYKMNRTSSMKGDCPMTDALKKFFEIVSNDEELKAKLNALIADEDAAGVVALAASCGIELSEDELTFHAAPETHELSDDELDAVAGGWKECVCVLAGGGKADADGLACACVAGGLGLGRKNKEATRCMCVASGFGESTECIMLGA